MLPFEASEVSPCQKPTALSTARTLFAREWPRDQTSLDFVSAVLFWGKAPAAPPCSLLGLKLLQLTSLWIRALGLMAVFTCAASFDPTMPWQEGEQVSSLWAAGKTLAPEDAPRGRRPHARDAAGL